MQVIETIEIAKPKEAVWQAITDIANADKMISAIIKLEVLENPESELVGFKWQETREMFGKEAKEIMWVTDAVENDFYCVRAESHGCVYLSKLSVEDTPSGCKLSMEFSAESQTLMAKIMSFLMARMMRNMMSKELQRDLNDIKTHLEKTS
jgi:uncharacterized membrane protein